MLLQVDPKRSLGYLRRYLWILLLPLSLQWALFTWLRRKIIGKSQRYHSRLFVLCVGNIHVGGSGKTPLVIEICKKLASRHPMVLSRGYKNTVRSERSVEVEPLKTDGIREYGDEAWLIAKRTQASVFVGADRVESVKLIESRASSGFLILDDGFQHLALERNFDLICINADRSPAENFCLPLGDLREPLGSLKCAHAVVLTTGPGNGRGYLREWRSVLRAFDKVPVFEAFRVLDGFSPASEFRSYAVFCGLGMPQSFFQDLAALNLDRKGARVFPDHHPYTSAEIDDLITWRKELGADALVTTEKDWVKCQDQFAIRGETVLYAAMRYRLPEEFWGYLGSCMDASK